MEVTSGEQVFPAADVPAGAQRNQEIETEFSEDLQKMRVQGGRDQKKLDRGKELSAEARRLKVARAAELEAAGQALHAAVDAAMARLGAELQGWEDQVLEAAKINLIDAAKSQAALATLEAQAAGCNGTPEEKEQLKQDLDRFLAKGKAQPEPASNASQALRLLRMGRTESNSTERLLARLEWNTTPPESTQRKCVTCAKLYFDPCPEQELCRSHPGSFNKGSASMPGWSCCFAQVC